MANTSWRTLPFCRLSTNCLAACSVKPNRRSSYRIKSRPASEVTSPPLKSTRTRRPFTLVNCSSNGLHFVIADGVLNLFYLAVYQQLNRSAILFYEISGLRASKCLRSRYWGLSLRSEHTMGVLPEPKMTHRFCWRGLCRNFKWKHRLNINVYKLVNRRNWKRVHQGYAHSSNRRERQDRHLYR